MSKRSTDSRTPDLAEAWGGPARSSALDESTMIDRFSRHFLVRGWSLAAQRKLSELRFGVCTASGIAARYLRGAGALSVSILDLVDGNKIVGHPVLLQGDLEGEIRKSDTHTHFLHPSLTNRFDTVIIDDRNLLDLPLRDGNDRPHALSNLSGMILVYSDSTVRLHRMADSRAADTAGIAVPSGPCARSVAQLTAVGLILRELLDRDR